jgi:hypothetical protein
VSKEERSISVAPRMTSMTAPTGDLARVDKLRRRLARREEVLGLLRKRIEAARGGAHHAGRPLSSVGDISRRFMNAAAESEARVEETRSFTGIQHSNGGVSSLLSKWNKGFDEKKIERERINVRGDVRSTKDMFNKADSSLAKDLAKDAAKARRRVDSETRYNGRGHHEELVVDDDVPSWAINQSKRVVKRESARGATQGVDLRETANSFLQMGVADVDTSNVRETVSARGNVSGVLAMWHQKSDEQEARERETLLREETMRKLKESMQSRAPLSSDRVRSTDTDSTDNLSSQAITELDSEPEAETDIDEDEPTDIRDLIEYLERKCVKVEKEIDQAEEELHKLDQLSQ